MKFIGKSPRMMKAKKLYVTIKKKKGRLRRITQQIKKQHIQQFKNSEDEAKFLYTNDISDYCNDFEQVEIDLQLEKTKDENIVVLVQKPIRPCTNVSTRKCNKSTNYCETYN